jgi:hypothetical protein
MNERLAKLTEQCYEYNETMQGAWFNKTKFAELIVQECGVALAPMLRDMVSRGQAYDLIKQHFGVEE